MRPDDWKNPFANGEGFLSPTAETVMNIYEAGADAYEEGLKKDGIYTYGFHFPDLDDAREVSGYWVFIPEE